MLPSVRSRNRTSHAQNRQTRRRNSASKLCQRQPGISAGHGHLLGRSSLRAVSNPCQGTKKHALTRANGGGGGSRTRCEAVSRVSISAAQRTFALVRVCFRPYRCRPFTTPRGLQTASSPRHRVISASRKRAYDRFEYRTHEVTEQSESLSRVAMSDVACRRRSVRMCSERVAPPDPRIGIRR